MNKMLPAIWLMITGAILWFVGYRAAINNDFASIWGGVGIVCAVLWWQDRKKSDAARP
jgi:hypothetical protein